MVIFLLIVIAALLCVPQKDRIYFVCVLGIAGFVVAYWSEIVVLWNYAGEKVVAPVLATFVVVTVIGGTIWLGITLIHRRGPSQTK